MAILWRVVQFYPAREICAKKPHVLSGLLRLPSPSFVHLSCIWQEEERLRFFRMRSQTNKLEFLLLLLSMATNQKVGSSNPPGRTMFFKHLPTYCDLPPAHCSGNCSGSNHFRSALASPVDSLHRARKPNRRRETPLSGNNRSRLHRADGMLGDGEATSSYLAHSAWSFRESNFEAHRQRSDLII